MKAYRRASWRVVCLALCLLLLVSALPAASRAEESASQQLKTVRVGFFAFDGYHETAADGTRTGYGYELLQHLAGYTNWQYEYVGYDKSWSEMQEMLAQGEIDLLTSAQKTPERMERFAFSDVPVGTSAAILTTRAGNETYALTDYENWSGIRVGMLIGNSRNERFADFAAAHGFTYSPVYYKDTFALLDALHTGRAIDAVLTSDLRSIDDEWILAEFDASPFYAIVRKADSALLAEVNDALGRLTLDEPTLFSDLKRAYYTPDNGGEIAFTPEERAFIERMRGARFTAAVNPDRRPFSSFENGAPTGIVCDVAKEIAARSGLSIELIETPDRAAYRALIASGGVDICLDARYDFASAEAEGYRLTAPYLDVSVSKLYRRGTSEFRSAALLREGDVSEAYLDKLYEVYESVVWYDTVQEVVHAVLAGAQDAAYLYSRSAELAVQEDTTNRLVAESTYGYGASLAVAVNAQQTHLLYSILKKTVASISADELRSIDLRYSGRTEKPFTIEGYMYEHPVQSVLFVLALCAVIASAALTVSQLQRRKRDAAQLAEEKRRGALLADALAAAERAGAAKNQFLSRVSHEMRTPLNAIIGFMSLAKDAEIDAVQSYLANSELAAKQLLSVINDVLDMSSIESGKMKIASTPFDFKHLLHAVTNVFYAQCRQKGVAFETKLLTPVDEWLVGDQLRLNQILLNLLSNAVKFTAEGHVWLEVSQNEAQSGKVFLRFAVSDTGCGMSEEMRARLFMPFEQESSATARKYGGSGLGLSIVKNLVGMMGGAIRAESAQGAGSTFTVDLPFETCDAENALAVPEGVKSLRVLAVDDEKAEREYLSAILGRMGVRHSCAENGDAALQELARTMDGDDPYNLCIVDWKMPDMNGVETTRRIRERYGKHVIVIVVSAYEYHQAGESAHEAGANLFISKPLFQSSLFDLFMNLTGGRIAPNGGERAAHAKPDFAGRRVLLAEDNAMNRMVAMGLVRKFGIACDAEADGKLAVERFLASAPGAYDAILMDIQMPNMDGFEATRLIRASAHPDAAHIQIIALTANAFNEDIAKALSSGMNAHVSKPIEPELLLATLERAFAARDRENA